MRTTIFAAALAAFSTPALAAFPVIATGEFCALDVAFCQPGEAYLQAGGVGSLFLPFAGFAIPLQWRRNGNSFDMITDGYVFRGTLAAGCASGGDIYPVGQPAMSIAYEWYLCVN